MILRAAVLSLCLLPGAFAQDARDTDRRRWVPTFDVYRDADGSGFSVGITLSFGGPAAKGQDAKWGSLPSSIASSDVIFEPVREKVAVCTPFHFPKGERCAEFDHLIFRDETGQGMMADYHEPHWKTQAELLQGKLRELGAEEVRIHIIPIKKAGEFMAALKAASGPAKVYVFGHAAPLEAHFGLERVKVADIVDTLKERRVAMLCHYGCSFADEKSTAFGDVQKKLKKDDALVIYGHRRASDKQDDSPWDKANPIIRCEIGKDCVKVTDSEAAFKSVRERVQKMISLPAFP